MRYKWYTDTNLYKQFWIFKSINNLNLLWPFLKEGRVSSGRQHLTCGRSSWNLHAFVDSVEFYLMRYKGKRNLQVVILFFITWKILKLPEAGASWGDYSSRTKRFVYVSRLQCSYKFTYCVNNLKIPNKKCYHRGGVSNFHDIQVVGVPPPNAPTIIC